MRSNRIFFNDGLGEKTLQTCNKATLNPVDDSTKSFISEIEKQRSIRTFLRNEDNICVLKVTQGLSGRKKVTIRESPEYEKSRMFKRSRTSSGEKDCEENLELNRVESDIPSDIVNNAVHNVQGKVLDILMSPSKIQAPNQQETKQ
ncbi:unnamed protein product [Lepeophtheirus salmonis]|uniref:(salmon louse) hypothetical protein n=1 Tax=Lepeophtheirus salmonis TaxID=72036 RepID=A0A7R8CE21_LEPSM|nr:unnamed protein product [Lepeophtheirus salmonis]CAF2791524.1 unnamed protein product [Lepeophtheirus salmonis]